MRKLFPRPVKCYGKFWNQNSHWFWCQEKASSWGYNSVSRQFFFWYKKVFEEMDVNPFQQECLKTIRMSVVYDHEVHNVLVLVNVETHFQAFYMNN